MQGGELALRGGGRLQHQGLEPSGVWARGPSSLGTGLVFLAFLSLQVKKPAQGGGVQKTHQQQKPRSNKCQPEGKRQKIRKRNRKLGRKRSEKQGHSLAHTKNGGCLWRCGGKLSMCSKEEQMLPAQVLWQSTEHPGSPQETRYKSGT